MFLHVNNYTYNKGIYYNILDHERSSEENTPITRLKPIPQINPVNFSQGLVNIYYILIIIRVLFFKEVNTKSVHGRKGCVSIQFKDHT